VALSVNTSGSQTATGGGTEDVLATVTTANVFCLAVDLSNMASGATPDILVVKEYGKARSSDTERLLKEYSIVGVQTETLFITTPRVSPHHYKVSITQTQGTARAYPWAIYQCQ
jgi:hypothetical protein